MVVTRAALAALVVLVAPSLAHADGFVAFRGGYYKERSTRVVQPMLDAQADVSPAGAVNAHALVDSITSASPSAGAVGGAEFNEKRYEGGVGYTHDFGAWRLGGDFRTSDESDYTSTYAGLRGDLELFDKNTTLALALGRSFDVITNGVTGLGTPRREELQVGLTSLSVTQLLAPRLVGNLTYDFIDAHGYQANIYRVVTGGSAPVPERVPDLRLRHAVYAGVRGFLAPTHTTGIVGYRFYADDWGIVAHTAEGRVIQEVVPGLDLRLRYRYYTQSKADFYEDVYSAAEIEDQGRFVTDDQKLSAHQTQTLGGQVMLSLGVLGFGGSLADVRLDVSVERVWQTTDFGDAWVAQAGMTVPFAY